MENSRPPSTAVRAGMLVAAVALVVAGCYASPDAALPGDARTVTHTRGQTDVPATPQRAVVLEPAATDTSVALGVPVVGATVFSEAAGVPKYLGQAGSGITSVGVVDQPSLERIAALRPDIIIGTETRHGALYEQLSAIAPTIFIADHLAPWQDNVRFVGTVLGRAAALEASLQRFRDRCAEIGRKHATSGRSAQMIRPRSDQFILYGPASFAGTTIECTGLRIPSRDWQNAIQVSISPELVGEARADDVFVTVADPAARDPLPQALAAREGSTFPRLHRVDQALWITGVGPIGGMAVLDDIDRALGGDR